MSVTFTTTVREARPGVTGFKIPAEIIATLSDMKRPPVKVTVNGYTYQNTVGVYGEDFLLSLSKEHREAAGVEAGQDVELTLELDLAPRTVEVPEDLKAALGEKGMEKFEKLAPSHKKEWVRSINEAKAEETRKRRIEKAVEALS
ncbi:MAG: YdeI/OmpD-associated family protein [bacterium]